MSHQSIIKKYTLTVSIDYYNKGKGVRDKPPATMKLIVRSIKPIYTFPTQSLVQNKKRCNQHSQPEFKFQLNGLERKTISEIEMKKSYKIEMTKQIRVLSCRAGKDKWREINVQVFGRNVFMGFISKL